MYVDLKCLENFFRRMKHKGITDDDIIPIIRRLDLDSDGKLRKEELIKGIQA
jgi:Ca2+-binding EF-hand superfamily protein